ADVAIRPARAFELGKLRRFITEHFHEGWADEAAAGFKSLPNSTLLATARGEGGSQIVGFACYDCVARGFFGPTGVDPAHRKKGIGRALLLATLHAMHHAGYAYGIIGDAGPTAFYEEACSAIPIAGSDPGTYTDMLA
ncbi:MAG: GNAT family N-acetyltransferase, partial [Planctomycetota bacterium]